MANLFAVALRVSEKVRLGPAVVGIYDAYEGDHFHVMSRVVCHTMFFGRWLKEDVRVVADYDSKLNICQDVTLESLSMYVSFNRGDAEAASLLGRLKRSPR